MVLAPGIGKVFEDGLIQIILQREFAPMSHAQAWLIGAGREERVGQALRARRVLGGVSAVRLRATRKILDIRYRLPARAKFSIRYR